MIHHLVYYQKRTIKKNEKNNKDMTVQKISDNKQIYLLILSIFYKKIKIK